MIKNSGKYLTVAIVSCLIIIGFISPNAKAGKPGPWQPNYEVDVWIGGTDTDHHAGHGYVYAERNFSTIYSYTQQYSFELSFSNCVNNLLDHVGQFYIRPATRRSTGMFSYYFPDSYPDGTRAGNFQLLATLSSADFIGDWEGGTFDLKVPVANLYAGSNQTPTGCPPFQNIFVHGVRIP